MRPIERPIALFGLMLAACSSGSDVPSSLGVLADTAAVPGQSLGMLRLGTTTLREVLEEHGPGRSSMVTGDEYGFELSYGGGQLNLLFGANPECHSRLMQGYARDAADALQDGERLLADFPSCSSSTLRSLAVAAAPGSAEGFYRGTVRAQVGLGALIETALASFGPGDDQRGLWLAGSNPDDARFDRYDYRDGLALFTGTAPAGPNEGRLVVRKIVLFTP